jgi:hypothetical protein
MKIQIPTRDECFYILEMIDTGLIDYIILHPWVEKIIEETDKPPVWIIDLAINKNQNDLKSVLTKYVYGEPFVEPPKEIHKFHMGCLLLLYKQKRLSWVSFLIQAGEYLDCVQRDWDCETPYYYLTLYEKANCKEKAEKETKKKYLKEHNLEVWEALVKVKLNVLKVNQ